MKFTTSDINTLSILVINDSKLFCDKSYVCKEVKNFFKTNPDEFNICYFLYNWENLKSNGNFAIFKISNGIEYIGLQSTCNELTGFTKPDTDVNLKVDVIDAIVWLCTNYPRTKNFAKEFLLNNFEDYSSVYELLNANKGYIGHRGMESFINCYSNIFDSDEIIKLIIKKKQLEWIEFNNMAYKKKHYNKSRGLTYGMGLSIGIGFVSFTSILLYKNTYLLNNFGNFLKNSMGWNWGWSGLIKSN